MPAEWRSHLLLLLLLVAVGAAQAVTLDAAEQTSSSACQYQSTWSSMFWQRCICSPCDRCKFSLLQRQCVLLQSSALHAQLRSGQPAFALAQPELSPAAWFLTSKELAQARGGLPRVDMQVFTEGNNVQLFMATNQFFASLYDDLQRLDTSDTQVLLIGWSLDNVPFVPTAEHWAKTTLKRILGRLLHRNVTVNALVWANLIEREANIAIQQYVNKHDTGILLFDNRLPYPTSSHHQKAIVIRTNGGEATAAYVGGTDLMKDRWDTQFHNQSKLRHQRRIEDSYDGWMDASCRIDGPAVVDVETNFIHRWNDEQEPLQETDELLEFENPSIPTRDLRLPLPPDPSWTEPSGTASIQVVRTFSCRVGYDFAPRGEISLLASRLKAIRMARNFIYIEDQYFIHVPLLLQALLVKLPTLQALVIVTQKSAMNEAAVGYHMLLYKMLHPLQAQFPDKVVVLSMKPSLELYIHSKVLLVDDVYLSIGSGNWNQRSMSSDSELTANVVDTALVDAAADGVQVAVLARSFRLKRFSELSGRSEAWMKAQTLQHSIQALIQAADDPESLVAPLKVQWELYYDVFPSGLSDIVDPFDQCDGDTF